MNRLARHHRSLLLGFALSLVIHLSALWGVGRASLAHFLTPSADFPSNLPLPVQDPFNLGIADSDTVTVTWLGFEEPTEHSAPVALTEQPALAINAGPSDPAPPDSVPPAPESPPTEPAPPTPPPPAEAARAEDAGDTISFDSILAELGPLLDRLAAAAAQVLAAAPQPTQAPAETASGDPGEASDRDSDPTAFLSTIDVVPGHPVARRGLDIKTVRPKWVNLTRMTTRPDNPTVIIKFRRAGTVSQAEFVEGRGTGYPSVDGPLLDAIYSWKASGEALQRLSPADPSATLEVKIRVIMQ